MLTAEVIRKARKLKAQLGELTGPIPRDCLPSSYYAQESLERENMKILEEKAKTFLKNNAMGIIEKTENPAVKPKDNPIIKYLLENKYIIQEGGTSNEPHYNPTPKGRKWAHIEFAFHQNKR